MVLLRLDPLDQFDDGPDSDTHGAERQKGTQNPADDEEPKAPVGPTFEPIKLIHFPFLP